MHAPLTYKLPYFFDKNPRDATQHPCVFCSGNILRHLRPVPTRIKKQYNEKKDKVELIPASCLNRYIKIIDGDERERILLRNLFLQAAIHLPRWQK
jgi:hypothetical protein